MLSDVELDRLDLRFKNFEVSKDTLRTEDLIENFLSFFKRYKPVIYANMLEMWRDSLPHTGKYDIFQSEKFENWIYDNDDDAMFFLEDLFNFMDEIAPYNCMFGAHEGNGSSFGFWEFYTDCDGLDYHMYTDPDDEVIVRRFKEYFDQLQATGDPRMRENKLYLTDGDEEICIRIEDGMIKDDFGAMSAPELAMIIHDYYLAEPK